MKVSLAVLTLLAGALAAPAPQAVLLPEVSLLPQEAPHHDLPQSVPVHTQVWPVIPYSYSYSVSDPETGNYQNRAEIKNELGEVFGSYSVLMPDNFIYTTIYNVTATSGFVARVEKSIPQPAASVPASAQDANILV